MEWTSLPGLDAEGFGTVERLRAIARRSPDDLVHGYPVPALLVEGASPGAASAARLLEDRERSFARTQQREAVQVVGLPADEDAEEVSDVGRYLGRVAFLAKRPGALFPDMITVGRALNSDITFVVASVSKVHGYFRVDGQDAWSFTDQRATNGTLVDGRRLEPGERVALPDGARLQLGTEILCTFLHPRSLARVLAGGK